MIDHKKDVIGFLEKHISDMDNEFDTLDNKAQQNIGVSSVIAAIVAALKISDLLPQGNHNGLLYLIFTVYAITFIISFVSLWPVTIYRTPLEPSLENIKKVEGKNDAEYHDWLLKTYLYMAEQNEVVLKRKQWLVRIGIGAIFVDVILIAAAALIA